jgi:hypothetical protein
MDTIKLKPALLLLLAGLAGGAGVAQAATSSGTEATANAAQQGVIDEVGGDGTLRVNGKRYGFSLLSASVHDRQGNRIDLPRLAVGMTIAFVVSTEGTTPRMKQIWIINGA